MCTLDEFTAFYLSRAYDVIGNGGFRKHLAKCKDSGDPWAVSMTSQIQAVAAQIREINLSVTSMQRPPNRLADICKDVMMSAQPPIRIHAGAAKCVITERTCGKCLDLSRTHKGTQSVHVDIRFSTFFMLLWFANKLEYIIRSTVRTWLDTRTGNETCKDLCDRFKDEHTPTIGKMHTLFIQARNHVLTTIDKHNRALRTEPILSLAGNTPLLVDIKQATAVSEGGCT